MIIKKTDIFDRWLAKLKDAYGKARILARLKRVELGNLGDHKSVGRGVFEFRIDCGPGYRIYFARRHDIIIILLIGGDKSTQQKDLEKAHQILIEIGE
jgi:putative addiction module killer protein